ncbi:GCN5 family acetyltransferase [Streptomyces sp. PRh5]|uniref:GNAT family N-acetyltransferase n=1 Tax=Streptomyces sp. PRh5 TaxID=1158056 RepID=UPI0004527478|nr:GNAT family N-acetyltransferase [Streptomyces sp. PRh5]EXU64365.1 GCN5 family acetyltransferase [Streptomyces sp. PRh5]
MALRDETLTRTRQASPDDLWPVNELHERCSARSRLLRYQRAKDRLTEREWRLLSDPARGWTFLTHPKDASDHIIGITHLMRLPDEPGAVELAMLVEDAWQSKGLGTALTLRAVALAQATGQHTLMASVLAVNHRALALVRRVCPSCTVAEGGERTFRMRL